MGACTVVLSGETSPQEELEGLCLIIRPARIWGCLEDLISPAVRRSREQAIRGIDAMGEIGCLHRDAISIWKTGTKMEGVRLLREHHPSSSAVQARAASSPSVNCTRLGPVTLGYRYAGMKRAIGTSSRAGLDAWSPDPEASWGRRVLGDDGLNVWVLRCSG